MANSSILLGVVPFSLAAVLTKTRTSLSRKWKTLALLVIVASVVISSQEFWDGMQLAGAADPSQEIELVLEPRNATVFPASDIYVVNGREYAHINELLALMGSKDLLFYRSWKSGVNQGPQGLIGYDDVVLIKINEEWPYRGGTNTDVLKELIQAIVDHPDGFVGEIVVADNGQWHGSMDWLESNAEDVTQSTQDVIDMFASSHRVSTYSWIPIRGTRVDEYSNGDMNDGYVLYDTADPETGIYVSYPKFRTQFGTYISFKNGIWNGAGYEKRLKVINMPVLKSHSGYGVTASLKHYMGVQSQGEGQEGLANGHSTVATGGMGTLMVETGLPTLNIIDAIWINANPPPSSLAGPSTPYDRATRVNMLMASTDPAALDYWAAKYVLVQTASLIGYTDTHTLDPGSTDRTGVSGEAFGVWLNRTKDEIIRGGYTVTTDESHMNVYLYTRVDTTPPLTTISLGGVLGNNDWFTSDVTVTLSASDDVEVDETEYRLDSANWTTYTSPFEIIKEGITIISYRSADKADNMEATKTETVKIDKTVPYGHVKLKNGANYTTTTSVMLTLSATDVTSGVAQMRFSHDNIAWIAWEAYSSSKTWTLTLGNGTKTVYAQFKDNAGLVSPSYQDTITLLADTTRPVANAGADQTVDVGETVTFDASGSSDNVEIVSYEWDFGNGGTGTGVTTNHTYDTPGTYTVTLCVRDEADNSDTCSITMNVLPTEAFPVWIIGATAAAVIGVIVALAILLAKRKQL